MISTHLVLTLFILGVARGKGETVEIGSHGEIQAKIINSDDDDGRSKIEEEEADMIRVETKYPTPVAVVEVDAEGVMPVRRARSPKAYSLAEDLEPAASPSADDVSMVRSSMVEVQAPTHDGSDKKLFLGRRPWTLALMVCFTGSLFTVLGFSLQKSALLEQQATKRWGQLGELVMSPMWVVGFIVGSICPLVADGAAYYLTSMSLLAPFSCVTLLLNQIIAPYLRGEHVHLWPDVPAAILIVTGVAATAATGRHGDGHGDPAGIDDLIRLGTNPHFLSSVAVLASMLVVSAVVMVLNRGAIEQIARLRRSNPPITHVLLPAICAACTAAATNLMLKASMGLLKAGAPAHVWAVFLSVVGPLAIIQLQFVNMGLRLYAQSIFFPVYNALMVVANTSVGILFYQDYVELAGKPFQCILFCLGVATVSAGIGCFHLREPESPRSSMTERMAAEYEKPRCRFGSVWFRRTPEPSLASRVPGMNHQG